MKKYRALLKIEGEESHSELTYQAFNMTEACKIAEQSRLEIALKLNDAAKHDKDFAGYKTVRVVLITEE